MRGPAWGPLHTDTSSTITDNNATESQSESSIFGGNILSLISDHLPQCLLFCMVTPLSTKLHPYLFAYDYRMLDRIRAIRVKSMNINMNENKREYVLR